MKSFIYIIITIAACSIVYGYAEKNPVIYAPQISAINVDGVLSDWESSSGWVTFGKWYPVANPGLSSTTKARYAWNEATNLLYIGIESTEGIGAVLEIGGLYATMDYNRDTSISALTEQLGLNPATQIEFSQWSGGTPQSIFNQDYGTTAGIVARYTYDGTKLTIEMAIPIYSNWFDSGSAMSLTSSMDVYVYANIFNAGWTAGDSQVADGRYMYLAKGSVVNRGSLVRLRPQAKPLNCDDVPYFGKDIADLDGNCMVNLADFAMIAASWMRCTDPCGIECDTFSGVIVKVDDYGAHGNGVDDDTAAFQSAAEVVQAFGGAISLGHNKVYRVGEQIHTDGVYPYYVYQPIISIDGVHGNKVAIIGNGATLKLNDGLRFGSFDKNTGAVYNPTLPFTDHAYDVGVGNIIQITNCDEVEIRDLTIDGNIDSVVLGGFFGDTGRQCDGVGVYLSKNSKVSVYNAYSHHNTLDGFYIADATATAGVLKPHSLMNVESFYNARQGLSWVGGNGLTVFDSKFSYTGRATFTSSPGAGCDIEAMVINRNGQFTNCKFVDNVGEGLISYSGTGDSANCIFTDCLFWGTTKWSIWPNNPGFKFINCDIYGSVTETYGSATASDATQFTGCHFEDVPGSYTSTALLNCSGQNVKFDGCTIKANQTRALNMTGTSTQEIFTNCDIYHNYNGLASGGYQSTMQGSSLSNTRFHESFSSLNYYISVGTVTVGSGVVVDGPRCKWQSTSGATGTITPGLY